jgi:hypothetical protein
MNPSPTQLILRIGQIDRATTEPPLTGGSALYRLVEGRMPLCAKHLLELGEYLPGAEARAVLSTDQIESLIVEFGLRRDDLLALHGPADPLLSEEWCRMCASLHAEGSLCYNDDCRRPLHPQWPAVYCSSQCALEDL